MKAALISLLLASMTLAGQANSLKSETGEPINKGTQHTGPSASQDSSTWQTVSPNGKGMRFKLPADWCHTAIETGQKFSEAGKNVRYIRTTFVPGEAHCMCLFEADNADLECGGKRERDTAWAGLEFRL